MEKPVIFIGEMVRAILEGRKTQTRRVINWKNIAKQSGSTKGKLAYSETFKSWAVFNGNNGIDVSLVKCPYGTVGTHLWVRETWGIGTRPHPLHGWVDGIEYKADCYYLEEKDDLILTPIPEGSKYDKYEGKGWKPSIHMPRWASRITLEVKEIRVERLQDISEDDAEKEGVKPYTAPAEMPAYKPAFADIWDKINYDSGFEWDVNPWVWVVSFERI